MHNFIPSQKMKFLNLIELRFFMLSILDLEGYIFLTDSWFSDFFSNSDSVCMFRSEKSFLKFLLSKLSMMFSKNLIFLRTNSCSFSENPRKPTSKSLLFDSSRLEDLNELTCFYNLGIHNLEQSFHFNKKKYI